MARAQRWQPWTVAGALSTGATHDPDSLVLSKIITQCNEERASEQTTRKEKGLLWQLIIALKQESSASADGSIAREKFIELATSKGIVEKEAERLAALRCPTTQVPVTILSLPGVALRCARRDNDTFTVHRRMSGGAASRIAATTLGLGRPHGGNQYADRDREQQLGVAVGSLSSSPSSLGDRSRGHRGERRRELAEGRVRSTTDSAGSGVLKETSGPHRRKKKPENLTSRGEEAWEQLRRMEKLLDLS